MKGHIRARGKDTWQIIICVGRDAEGRYKYKSETVHELARLREGVLSR